LVERLAAGWLTPSKPASPDLVQIEARPDPN
jgi:hypothetical protein